MESKDGDTNKGNPPQDRKQWQSQNQNGGASRQETKREEEKVAAQ
jgi:hypothetical protein